MHDQMIGIERGAAYLDQRIAKSPVAGAVDAALREWPNRSAGAAPLSNVTVRLLNGTS